MPSPKPRKPKTSSAHGGALETERTQRALSLFLQQTQGFRMAIALHNDPVQRDQLLHALGDELSPLGFQVLVLGAFLNQ